MSEFRARVALPLALPSTVTCAVPPELRVAPGVRVRVRYRGRPWTGVVVAVDAPGEAAGMPGGDGGALPAPRDVAPARGRGAAPARRRRAGPPPAIEAVLDAEPALPPELLATLVEAADTYLCPIGLAVHAALPPGSSPRPGRWVELTPSGRRVLERGEVRGSLARLLWAIGRAPKPESALRRRFPELVAGLERLERLGWIARRVGAEPPRARPRTERVYALDPDAPPEALERAIRRAPRRRALVERLRAEGPLALPPSPALRALVAAGLVRVEERPWPRRVLGPPLRDTGEEPLELTPHQREAVRAIEAAIAAGSDRTFLLYGITGSGKTEVYVRAAEAAVARGRGAIVLVPEITLTHQVVDRFRARFGERIALLHSGLGEGERLEQWEAIRRGELPVVVGARSAVFAPVPRLGLLVVDEEHDPAYKSEEGFRYHAREIARMRAARARCPLVLGSATPDVETAYAAARGEIERLVLPERVARRPLPAVEIVDMEAERARHGRRLLLSRALRRALAETLAAGRQAILFLNRRGFATCVYCFGCGYSARCKHCDIALVYHATEGPRGTDRPVEGELRCHHCGYREDPPERCPRCGGSEGALLGFGTERVAEEAAALFPHARIERLDRDTASRKGAAREILRAFHRGEIDILVGTQMVTKGHDVPGVTLVGVVAADLGLQFPDFRAAERTFQLLEQVAGRAGRGEEPGRVVVQTFLPDHYAIACARTHDYAGFLREELRRRRPHGYPPFRRMARFVVAARDAGRAEAAARRLAAAVAAVPASREAPLEPLGPAPAPIARLRDRARWQLLLLGPRSAVPRAAREILETVGPELRGVEVRVDVDPVGML